MKNLEIVVRQVVTEYLKTKQLHSKQDHNRHTVSILLAYETRDASSIWDAVRKIAMQHDVVLFLAEGWQYPPPDLSNKTCIEIRPGILTDVLTTMMSTDALLIPNVSYGLLAKIALTIDDDPSSWLAIQMQLTGKVIVLADDTLNLKGKAVLTTPSPVWNRIQTYMTQLKKEAVYLMPLAKVERWLKSNDRIPSEKRQLLLAKHVDDLVQSGEQEVILSKSTRVTPMARDRAKELGLQIKWEP